MGAQEALPERLALLEQPLLKAVELKASERAHQRSTLFLCEVIKDALGETRERPTLERFALMREREREERRIFWEAEAPIELGERLIEHCFFTQSLCLEHLVDEALTLQREAASVSREALPELSGDL